MSEVRIKRIGEEEMSIHISKIVVLLMLTGSAFGQQSKPSPPKQDIRTIEADNGTVYRFDMTLVRPAALPGGFYVMVHDSSQDSWESTIMEFDCAGHFMIMSQNGEMSEWMYAPPRSVAGRIAEMVCRRELSR